MPAHSPAIKALIVDDELQSRRILSAMLERYCPQITVAATAASIEEARHLLPDVQPDVVFLDVEMPLGSGFELLRQAPEHQAAIIFVTAHEHYALKALKAGALDYLLKPLDIDELQTAVRKLSARITQAPAQPTPTMPATPETMAEKLAVPTKNGAEFVAIQQIIQLKADGGGTWIFLQDGRKLFSSRNIGAFEDTLPGPGQAGQARFFRIHHGAIVNLHYVKNFNAKTSVLTVENGLQLEVSQRRKSAFLEIFKSA
jgi:two-component system LytT family response regulator